MRSVKCTCFFKYPKVDGYVNSSGFMQCTLSDGGPSDNCSVFGWPSFAGSDQGCYETVRSSEGNLCRRHDREYDGNPGCIEFVGGDLV
jgi:hypothetical protein